MADEVHTGAGDRVAAAYEGYYGLLHFIAAQRFKILASDIRPLIHDVFVAFMRHAQVVGDDRRWLATAICNACLNYWRDRKVASPLTDVIDPRRLADDAAARLDVAMLLAPLSPNCRKVLLLRYVLGLKPAEIAERYARKVGYVKVLVHRCLKAGRKALAEKQ